MPRSLEVERPEEYLTRLAVSDFGRAYKSLVLDEMRIEPGAVVVDLGCGPGLDVAAFADSVGESGHVLGIDIDLSAVERAARLAASRPQISVQHGDIHHLTLADQSVDRVHTDRVLQHVTEPAIVVAEAKRVLRPGGLACFAEPDWDTLIIDHPNPAIPDSYRRFVTSEVVRNSRIGRQLPALCDAAGLQVARVVPITAVFRDVVEADRVLGLHRVTRRAVEASYLSAAESADWLTHLRLAPLFISVTLFVTLAERVSPA